MTRPTFLIALLFSPAALAQNPPPAAPDPGDLTKPTPPIVLPIKPVVVPPPVTLPPPPNAIALQPLTAAEAARIALKMQPDVTIARAEIAAAQGVALAARAGLRPAFGLSAGLTQQESLSGTSGSGVVGDPFDNSSSSGLRAGATVTQLLFDFGRTRLAVREAAARETAASANLTRVQSDLVLRVKRAFYSLTQNARLVGVNESNLKNRQDQLALAQARLGAGLGAPADVVRAQTAVAEAVFNLETARNMAATARVNLALAMGMDPRTPLETADSSEAEIANGDMNILVNSALQQRPEMAQAQANIRAADLGIAGAQKGRAPSVGLSVGVAGRGNAASIDKTSARASLNLNWPIFDGGLSKGHAQSAQAYREMAQAQLTSARQTIIADVSQAYLNLRTAEQSVISAEAQVANAEESARLAAGRYRAGVGTFIEVTDAQAALLTARTNRVNARSNVDSARAELSRAIGQPLPR